MINIKIHSQPDDETCGPTSLHAVYQYYGLDCSLEDVIKTVERTITGGSLAAFLGADALRRGFKATIYANNILLFDPTWFKNGIANSQLLSDKLLAQMEFKKTPEIIQATGAYINFLALGGVVKFETLNPQLLKKYFTQSIPILTGLSSTYLYESPRCVYRNSQEVYSDLEGVPSGHFVLLCGYDDSKNHVVVADPYEENPHSHDNYYSVDVYRLINSIMLGVITYDSNLLVVEPIELPQLDRGTQR